ncbi:MAG: HPF/RaiA family ribosome-associated protein [Saprospiraceae bacterium]
MNVNIQAPFTIKSDQESDIINQIKSLSTYNDRITNAEIFFKTGDGSAADSVVAEIELRIPGPVVFASADDKQFMNAFSGAINKVKKQLIKAKETRRNH